MPSTRSWPEGSTLRNWDWAFVAGDGEIEQPGDRVPPVRGEQVHSGRIDRHVRNTSRRWPAVEVELRRAAAAARAGSRRFVGFRSGSM